MIIARWQHIYYPRSIIDYLAARKSSYAAFRIYTADLPSLPLLAEDLPLFRVFEKTFRYALKTFRFFPISPVIAAPPEVKIKLAPRPECRNDTELWQHRLIHRPVHPSFGRVNCVKCVFGRVKIYFGRTSPSMSILESDIPFIQRNANYNVWQIQLTGKFRL